MTDQSQLSIVIILTMASGENQFIGSFAKNTTTQGYYAANLEYLAPQMECIPEDAFDKCH